jgi:hypothetical protein
MVRPCSCPSRDAGTGWQLKEHSHVQQINATVATMGIDIGKNSFHVVGLDAHGAIGLNRDV